MSQLVTAAAEGGLPTNLHAELRTLIASSRQRLAGAVNAELTRLYWAVGQRLATEVLGGERAQYGSQLLEQLGQQLSQEFGRGFEARNLRRMVKFAQAFPSAEIVSTLSTKLSWSHMVAIVALKNPQARQFYAQQAAQDSWSVRELTHQIERKAFERTELAALQAPLPVLPVQAEPVEAPRLPALVFKDPYFLDFLGLRQGHDEADLDAHTTVTGCTSFHDQGRARTALRNAGRLCIYADQATGRLQGAEMCTAQVPASYAAGHCFFRPAGGCRRPPVGGPGRPHHHHRLRQFS